MIRGMDLTDEQWVTWNKVIRAVEFAIRAHAGTVRKFNEDPYVTHPIYVFRILMESPWKFTAEELQAAVLHDVIEDTKESWDKIQQQFGDRVAAMVWLLSRPKNVDMAKEIYWAALAECSPTIIAIKLADITHNMSDLIIADDATAERREWVRKFKEKMRVYGMPLLGVLRLHGDCWKPYADWIEEKIRKRLDDK